jgi:hypothetical protein
MNTEKICEQAAADGEYNSVADCMDKLHGVRGGKRRSHKRRSHKRRTHKRTAHRKRAYKRTTRRRRSHKGRK